jgi:ubiquinone biosynthesis protein Coq4
MVCSNPYFIRLAFIIAVADMVAAVGDLTSGPILPTLRDHMLASPEGRRILKERPRINTNTVEMQKLASLPEGTFGRTYVTWLQRCNVTPDTREPVSNYYHSSPLITPFQLTMTTKGTLRGRS